MSKQLIDIHIDNLVDRYSDMVFRIAVTHMKNRTDADDIFQEVFLKLCDAKTAFQSDEHIKAWLIRVTINTCNRAHKSKHNNVVALHQEATYEDKYADTDVMDAVWQLPQKYRTVVYLFYYEDMAVAQISKTLGIGEAAIKKQLSRARQMLKDKLGGEQYVS